MSKKIMIGLVILLLAAAVFTRYSKKPYQNTLIDPATSPALSDNYVPPVEIKAENFTSEITKNPYFNLPVGKKMTYQQTGDEGSERIEIQILDETKEVMGVMTRVYWDRVWNGDVIVEDTRDYLAQDLEGNVWYFGEDVKNYEEGVLANTNGSWIAGVDGALPGIWFKANPQVGDSYRQEFYKNFAEDMADVVGINETVETAKKTYTGCVKTYDWTPLERISKEYKYYCPEVGGVVLIEHAVKGERRELLEVSQAAE